MPNSPESRAEKLLAATGKTLRSYIDRVQWNDDLEILLDDDTDRPRTSRADDGVWVAAWVWVPNEDGAKNANPSDVPPTPNPED